MVVHAGVNWQSLILMAPASFKQKSRDVKLPLQILLLLQCFCVCLVMTKSIQHLPITASRNKVLKSHQTTSHAAVKSRTQSTSTSLQQDAEQMPPTGSLHTLPSRAFSPSAQRVAVVNPYMFSYPTVAAIVHAVKVSGIQPEVGCSPSCSRLISFLCFHQIAKTPPWPPFGFIMLHPGILLLLGLLK